MKRRYSVWVRLQGTINVEAESSDEAWDIAVDRFPMDGVVETEYARVKEIHTIVDNESADLGL